MNELYKLILVDDEDEIRGRIVSMITEETGFEVVGTASNGYDALELVEELSPHAVITDIRMPYIDGIALAQEMRSEFSKVKVAFLTGFGEFDYARKAVELEVISYLMKPVVKKDVLEFLVKLKKILDEEYDLINNIELLESNFEKNKQLFIEKQLNGFLIQGDLKPSDLNVTELYGLDFSEAKYIIGIIDFHDSSPTQEKLKSETYIREFFINSITQYEFIIPFTTSEGLAFIIKNKVMYESEVQYTISKLLSSKEDHDNVDVRVGLSSIFTDFVNFASKYQEASSTLSVSRFTNSGNVISYDDIESEETFQVILTAENIKEIDYVILFEDEKTINSTFNRYIKRAKKESNQSVDLQLYIIAAANIILRYSLSLGVDLKQHFKGGLLNHLIKLQSVVDILKFTNKAVIELRTNVINKANTRIVEISDSVFSYIDLNYTDSSINLELVASHFNISVSYLSSLLKKEKGISFNKYLVQVRINKAKELLKYSDSKIVEIAKKIGYNDVYYFSHSFKKNTSMSPKEYRDHE